MSEIRHAITGPLGKPEHLELQHKQADGLGNEDHPPHQQGGNGEWHSLSALKKKGFYGFNILQVHKTLGAGAVAVAE